ncbi:MAG TPA: LysR substrate-binding domain-containing protein [Ramlibacter sp.]|uniref:LysR family transcriptional regulator n=1 Tax=Ramlibacter sp. TaxID=1917967 RepID=UPI002D7FE475|nr:LysR substrate-binding domain-containing protein [Ramlibacter sp.]HET8745076.1 LysR substrate-binding domain-containing protein [Ramlibacter sp.]
MKNATLRQLRVFAAVGKHLNFARAAEELALSPPAVSMQIRELEEQVGLPLFDRTSRSVALTTVGEYVLAHARRVLAAMRDAEDMVANLRGLKTGVLDVVMVSTAKYFVPRLLAQFRQDHPGVEIRLRVAHNRGEIVRLMREGEVELAVMGRPPTEWSTRAEPFALHPHVLVTAPDHPFTRLELVPAAALAREAFIVREEGSGTRAALQEYIEAHHLTPYVAMEMASNEAIKQAVMAGMGVSLLSLHTLGLELAHGLIATPEVEGLPLMRRWHVVHALARTLSPAAEAFRYFMLERGEAFLAQQFGGSGAA